MNSLTIKIEKDTIYIKTKNLLKPLPKPLSKPFAKKYISCLQALHDKLKEKI